jgi:hypothetical protein
MSNWWEKAQKDIDKLASSKVANKTDVQLRAIDDWIDDEDVQARRRAGHALAHDKISEGLKNSRKHKEAIKTRDTSFRQDPTYQKEHNARMKAVTATDEWKENQRKGVAALRNDPERMAEYKENYDKGNTAKYDDPAFWEAYYAAIKVRDANPEQRKKIKAGTRKAIAVGCQTPLGVFECIQDAADAHQMGYNTVCHRLKSPTFPDWFRLDGQQAIIQSRNGINTV